MRRNVWKDIANLRIKRLNNCEVGAPCMDDHQFQEEENESVGELPTVRWQIVLKCLYLACIGRPDILWSVNQLARSITKWTKACDKRLSRLISYIHHTSDYKQYCLVGNTTKQCRLGLFQDSDFAGDLEDSKSTSGRTLCIFGSHTFVPISWMCKKQTSVSHSSTESELISLDAGLRMDGIPALDLWDLIVIVLQGNTNQSKQVQGDLSTPLTRKIIPGKIDDLDHVDLVSSHVNSSHQEAVLYVFEHNEAVIKMIIKGRSLTMRHVSRTHRVSLDWLFDRINLDPKIQIKYIDTKNQLADILTKGNFTRDKWNHLLCLFNISHFSSINIVKAMSKRTQEDAGEEGVSAKSKPMMNLVSRCSVRDPTVLASTASEIPVYLLKRRIISISNDSRKSNGYYIKTTRMFRTSSRCSIRSYSCQNGKCTEFTEYCRSQNVQIYGFVYHDTNGQNHGPAWTIQSFFLNEIYMVILWQDFCGKGHSRKFLLEHGWEEVPNWRECLFVDREKGLLLSVYVDEIKLAGKKQNIDPMWKVLMKYIDVVKTDIIPWLCLFGSHSTKCQTSKDIVDNYRNMFESKISAGATEKIPYSQKLGANISSWSYDVEGHAKKCVERYCKLANNSTFIF